MNRRQIPFLLYVSALMAASFGILLSGCERRGTLVVAKQNNASHSEGSGETNAPTSPALARYDKKVIKAIELRWIKLMNQMTWPEGTNARVVVNFRLHADGHISDLRIIHGTADEKSAQIC